MSFYYQHAEGDPRCCCQFPKIWAAWPLECRSCFRILPTHMSASIAKENRALKMPTEASAIQALFEAHLRLKDLGWQDAIYCPKDGTPFHVIELGSTGIHECTYEGEWPNGHWAVGREGDPSHPCLFKPLPSPPVVFKVGVGRYNWDAHKPKTETAEDFPKFSGVEPAWTVHAPGDPRPVSESTRVYIRVGSGDETRGPAGSFEWVGSWLADHERIVAWRLEQSAVPILDVEERGEPLYRIKRTDRMPDKFKGTPEGTVVTIYGGNHFGLLGDDTRYWGVECVGITLPSMAKDQFCTIPEEDLEEVKQAGSWYAHLPGDPCPVSEDTLVYVQRADGQELKQPVQAASLLWGNTESLFRVVAWKRA